MMSLFSSFDIFNLNFFFFFSLIFIFSFFNIYYISFLSSVLSLVSNLEFFFLSLKKNMFNKYSISLMTGLVFFIFFLNFLSIFPYIFSFTSQFLSIMFLSVSFWLSFMFFSLMNNFKMVFSHLIPEGSPINLSFFLFLIELVSVAIRPITLSVRLVANILSGHLMMILLYSFISNFKSFFFSYFILNVIEFVVSMIQSYIFATMLVLYFSEV